MQALQRNSYDPKMQLKKIRTYKIPKFNKPTWLRGNMSAMSFLYLFTGCLDLALIDGQKKQRLPQAGKTCREMTPSMLLIFKCFFVCLKLPRKLINWAFTKLCFLSLPN